MRKVGFAVLGLALLATACGPASEAAPDRPATDAELANGAALANEAAADEAADMATYGGNAAAMEPDQR